MGETEINFFVVVAWVCGAIVGYCLKGITSSIFNVRRARTLCYEDDLNAGSMLGGPPLMALGQAASGGARAVSERHVAS